MPGPSAGSDRRGESRGGTRGSDETHPGFAEMAVKPGLFYYCSSILVCPGDTTTETT